MTAKKVTKVSGRKTASADELSAELKEKEELFESIATDKFRFELEACLKARHPFVYLCTSEEKRALQFLQLMCALKGYNAYTWDCYRGIRSLSNNHPPSWAPQPSATVAPDDALDAIIEYELGAQDIDDPNASTIKTKKKTTKKTSASKAVKKRDAKKFNIYIMLDFHRFLERNPSPRIERQLRFFIKQSKMASLMVMSPSYVNSSTLDKDASVLDFPFPSSAEIGNLITNIANAKSIQETYGSDTISTILDENMELISQAATGLTLVEAQSALTKSVVMAKKLGHPPFDIDVILNEKKQIIKKSGVLEYYDSPFDVNDIAGLDPLMDWLKHRRHTFSEKAREYGLDEPKGVMLAGIPGSGKSLCAKVISNLYQMPLIRLDMGRLFNSLVGKSEETTRHAIQVCESIAPCILWIDEIEKAIAGGASSGDTDSGVTSRVISTFLTWMQEKTAPVFVVATANDVTKIPPEFMRAGRFDEIFFVDLPGFTARKNITEVLLNRKNRSPEELGIDLDQIAAVSEGYSGAELEKAIHNALLVGFDDEEREITTEDIVRGVEAFTPLSEGRSDEFATMREFIQGQSIGANTVDTAEDKQKFADLQHEANLASIDEQDSSEEFDDLDTE